jgi:hypothetical protein
MKRKGCAFILYAALLLVQPAGAEAPGEGHEAPGEGQAQTTAPEQVSTQEPSDVEGQAAESSLSEQEAMAILKRMAEFLAQTPQFSVKLRVGYDVVQTSGQKIEFGERRKLTLRRPDRLRIEHEQSDGDQGFVVFDGKDITVFGAAQNIYAQASKPGDIDGAITYFVRDLGMRLPLALLFVARLPAEIERRVESADYVEKSVITDVPTHHLAARTAGVDFQVWVAEGDKPLPQRVVITYQDTEGEPQFWAEFSDWNLAPATPESLFVFTPPEGAERIPFLAQLQPPAAPEPEMPPTGEAPQATDETGEPK